MGFHIGTYIAVAAVLFFYLRLIILQRQKVKQQVANPRKKGGKAAGPLAARPTLVAANKLLVALGVALILLGAGISFFTGLTPAVRDAWWLPVTAGILLMSLGIR